MKHRIEELRIILTADPKRAMVLGVLVLVAGVLGLKQLLSAGPGKASGAAVANGGGAQGSDARTKTSAGGVSSPVVHLPSVLPLTRDLFAAQALDPAPPPQPDPAVEGGEKSVSQGVEETLETQARLEREARERAVREEAERFSLRSVVLGSTPAAVIAVDGARQGARVFRLGESVAGFELVSVKQTEVTLRKQGVRIKLALRAP